MAGQLFTDYFLTAGIKATEEWRDSDTAFAAFRATLSARYRQFSSHQQPNEATTEQELIRPVLEALGWTDRRGPTHRHPWQAAVVAGCMTAIVW